MIQTLALFTRRNWRDSYPTLWAVFAELGATALNLIFYWYTSVAFGMAMGVQIAGRSSTYFSYVITGEIFLALPLALFIGVSRAVRTSSADGTLEPLILSAKNPPIPFLLMTLAYLPREISRQTLIILGAAIFFGYAPAGNGFGWASLLQLCSLPLFLGLGFGTAGLLLYTGRGLNFISSLGTVITLLAGVYFPLNVLPVSLHSFTRMISPFTALLEATRQTLADGNPPLETMGLLLILGVISVPVGFGIFSASLRYRAKRGDPLLMQF